MDFGNKGTFAQVYRELLSKTYEQYLHYKKMNDFRALYLLSKSGMSGRLDDKVEGGVIGSDGGGINGSVTGGVASDGNGNSAGEAAGIENILLQDSKALSDKIKNTASIIHDRLKIHDYFNYKMTYNWLYVKNELLDVHRFPIKRIGGNERRQAALEGQLVQIDKHMLDEKVKCWQDLTKEMHYFIDLYHKYQQLKHDTKLLK